eukprot:scaffold300_cov258-Pinguiococcus_pyrenoidosus.AAC.63
MHRRWPQCARKVAFVMVFWVCGSGDCLPVASAFSNVNMVALASPGRDPADLVAHSCASSSSSPGSVCRGGDCSNWKKVSGDSESAISPLSDLALARGLRPLSERRLWVSDTLPGVADEPHGTLADVMLREVHCLLKISCRPRQSVDRVAQRFHSTAYEFLRTKSWQHFTVGRAASSSTAWTPSCAGHCWDPRRRVDDPIRKLRIWPK